MPAQPRTTPNTPASSLLLSLLLLASILATSLTAQVDATSNAIDASASCYWLPSSYGECDVSCGTGIQSRSITCYCGDAVSTDDSCAGLVKPDSITSCSVSCVTFGWSATEWSGCETLECGSAFSSRSVSCLGSNGVTIESSYCDGSAPIENLACSAVTADCSTLVNATWNWGEWTSCSASCGSGHETRDRWCIGSDGVVDDTNCDCDNMPTYRECNLGSCETMEWSTTGYSTCSTTCGTGFESRTVTCVSSARGVVASSECDPDTSPEQVQLCYNDACPTYSWQESGFVCAVTCGSGTATQTVTCVEDTTGALVDDSYCTDTVPATAQDCEAEIACRTCSWSSTELTTCSSTCGLGEQSREVSCTCSDGSVDDSLTLCDGAMPDSVLSCEAACPICYLLPGDYSECSATCGTEGVATRDVTCICDGEVTALDFAYCPTATQSLIDTIESCNVRDCPVFSWVEGGFGTCSADCGNGYQSQTVTCQDQDGNQVEASFCDSTTKPAEQQECSAESVCQTADPQFSIWSDCSASCGSGFQTRDVWCELNGEEVAVSECESMADASQVCNNGPCEVVGWTTGDWQSCSSTCIGGVATRDVRCVSDQRGIISDSACDADTRPVSLETCNDDVLCPFYEWSSQGWGECSTTCGAGVSALSYTCVEMTTNTTVDTSYCGELVSLTSVQLCASTACEIFDWAPSVWGECSVTCGDGVSTRTVTCVGSYGTKDLTNTMCSGTRPDVAADCYAGSCPTYSWKVDSYDSGCSATCDVGVETRAVWCQESPSGLTVEADKCSASGAAPDSSRECEYSPCPSSTYVTETNWVAGDFSLCDVSCGSGTQECSVSCIKTVTVLDDNGNVLNVSTTTMEATYCSDAVMPTTSISCDAGVECLTPYWLPGTSGFCSASCGTGIKSREVVCWDPNASAQVDDSLCSDSVKPDTIESCTLGPCETFGWEVSDFGLCSVTCGTGISTRVITCVSSQNGVVDNTYCDAASKPSDYEECAPGVDCVTCVWTVGVWSGCSATCGVGLDTRDVTCSCSDGTTSDTACASLTSYISSKTCIETNLCESFEWLNTTSWSECSASCGTGVITRTVSCVGDVTGDVDTSGLQCSSEESMESSQACEAAVECEVFGWVYGDWSSCSVTCGFGVVSRSQTCVGSFGTIDTTGAQCAELDTEATAADCFPRTCEVCTWQVGTLSECGVTCGNGVQVREVACVGNRGTVCETSACSGTAPESTVVCELACCTTYSWYVGAYGSCSVTCGTGTKSRDVYCHDAEGLVVDASYCSGTHPGYDTECDSGVVCSAPSWTNGDWSDCSSSCGAGTRTRSVSCVSVDGATVLDDSACSGDAPSSTSECNLCACESTVWEVSSWSDCSVTCGTGFQTRTTDCRSTLRGYVPSSECSESEVVDHQTCVNVCYSWTAGAWGECVDGVYTRNVYCVGTNGKVDKTGAQCSGDEQPSDTGVCA